MSRIDHGQRRKFGTTSPGEKLHVAGNIRVGDEYRLQYIQTENKGINNADVELQTSK